MTLVRGNQVRFYLNGALNSYAAQTGAFGMTHTEPVRIGTRKDNYTYFNGAMDDLRIYSRALNDEEINALAK